MDPARVAVYAAAAIIIALTLISGPLVGAVDFTQERYSTSGLGEGSATVSDVRLPDSASLEKGRYGSEVYGLQVPATRFHIDSIQGKPIISYRISIRELGYTRGTTVFLSPQDQGWKTAEIERDTFAPDEITRDEYAAELTLTLRASDNETVLASRNVTVEVTD